MQLTQQGTRTRSLKKNFFVLFQNFFSIHNSLSTGIEFQAIMTTTIQEPSKSPTPKQQVGKNSNHLSTSVSITNVADFSNENLEPCKNVAPRGPFADSYSNICSASAGAKILFATDDWFATADCLLKDGPPIFDEALFCEQGKVMDGWETRRRREEG